MYALIRIDAHRSRTGQPERPARQHPFLQEVVDQAFAQPDLQRFRQPTLHDVEYEQGSCDQEEYAELEEKVPQVAARQCIEEGLIPAVEANLTVGGGDEDKDDGRDQHPERPAHGRGEYRAEDHPDLPHEAQIGGLAFSCRTGGICRGLCHRGRIPVDPRSATIQAVVQMISAGPCRTVTDSSSKLSHARSLTSTLRSGDASGGRRTILALTPAAMENRSVVESVLRSE